MDDIVRVWIVSAEGSPANADLLDAAETERAGAYLHPRDRHRFIVAHTVLRVLAARELGARPESLSWTRGPHGKPELPGLHTSLSHADDLIAVAISTTRPVGIDIEHVNSGVDVVALSARFFPPEEARYVAAGADPDERAGRFTHLWTRKEAAVKAVGSRLWPNLKMPVRDSDVVNCLEPPSTHRVADITAPPGCYAAVALTGSAPFAVDAALALNSRPETTTAS